MKKILMGLLLMGTSGVLCAATPSKTSGKIGVGVIVGEPFGPTIKYWSTDTVAFDAGVGFENDPIVYADVLFQNWKLLPQPASGKWALYAGVGPRWQNRDHEDDTFGIRVPFGITYFVEKSPIEIFGELVPVFQVSPKTDSDFDGGIGVRFLFG